MAHPLIMQCEVKNSDPTDPPLAMNVAEQFGEVSTTTFHQRKFVHKVIWHNLFTSTELQSGATFYCWLSSSCLPISNVYVLFMKRVKTDKRASLGEKRFNSLLCVTLEGSEMKDFNSDMVIFQHVPQQPKK